MCPNGRVRRNEAEVIALLNDLKDHDVDLVTIGQYLQPSKSHAPIHRFVNLQEFERYTQHGQRLALKISGVRQWSVLAILPIGNISVKPAPKPFSREDVLS